MKDIVIKEVKSRKEIKDFLEFANKLYKDCPYFVPPLYGDERNIFKKNFIYNDTCETVCFNAYVKDMMVGRISGILQKASNEKWKQKRVRFTRFDSINDQDVANALFKAVEDWARSKGMEEVVGPLNYSDLEREGLLIDGFDYLSTFEEQYNFDYYQKLIENLGYKKEVDWIEHRLKIDPKKAKRYLDAAPLISERFNLKFVEPKSKRAFINKYKKQFFELLDSSYENIYGTVPFTDKMKKNIISNFMLVINTKFFGLVVDENDKVVAFSASFPAIGDVLVGTGGHLTPKVIVKLLKEIKHPHHLDLGLIGVSDEYSTRGAAVVILAKMMQVCQEEGIEYSETNLNLEDNYHIINQWANFDSLQHKRRRSYVKKI